jgi:hypothetical protein
MKKKTWVLLSLSSVLLVFCAVRAVRSPAVSAGAQSPAVYEDPARSDESQTSVGANYGNAGNEAHLRQLETAGAAQRMRQQEAAHELQRRQQQAARPLS